MEKRRTEAEQEKNTVTGAMASLREIYRGLQAKRWLAAAMVVEFLGLAGAVSAIPSLGLLPLIWALAAVGILSTVGVVIITAHYILEYSRRPLNDVQRAEIEEFLSGYLTTGRAQELVPKPELTNFVRKRELHQLWQYQHSVFELGWAVADELPREPGYVVVAEWAGMAGSLGRIEFSLLPPPVEVIGKCSVSGGEALTGSFFDWGEIFREFETVVFYVNAHGSIEYLRTTQGVAFSGDLVGPVIVPRSAKTMMPVLVKKAKEVARPRRDGQWEWAWELRADS